MKRILIIEDEKSIAEIERDYLEVEGFSVTIENNGASGYATAESEDFDLIILDIMLPDMDGFEICRRLRRTHDTPMIMVSAKDEKVDKIRGLGLGADDYITKPFDPAELVARVKSAVTRYDRIKGSGSEHSTDIVYKELVIQPLSRRVFFKEKEIFLTAKEFDLLYFLAGHPNRVFSKDEIYKQVWGMEPYGDSGTVVVHLTHLKDKIPMDYIETKRGVGYLFSMVKDQF